MKKLIVIVLVMLLIPAVAVAQSDIVDLVMSDDQTQIGIVDSFESMARVVVDLNGKQYMLDVPVTISVDAMAPLSDSKIVVDSATRVGYFAIDILDSYDEFDEYDIDDYREVEPSSDDNKLIVITARMTNLDTEPQDYRWGSVTLGLDNLGQEFEPETVECEELNPGESDTCVIVFDVENDVSIIGLDISAKDHKRIVIPQQEQ